MCGLWWGTDCPVAWVKGISQPPSPPPGPGWKSFAARSLIHASKPCRCKSLLNLYS